MIELLRKSACLGMILMATIEAVPIPIKLNATGWSVLAYRIVTDGKGHESTVNVLFRVER